MVRVFWTNQSKANERKFKIFPEYNRQSIENCSSGKLWSVVLFLPISAFYFTLHTLFLLQTTARQGTPAEAFSRVCFQAENFYGENPEERPRYASLKLKKIQSFSRKCLRCGLPSRTTQRFLIFYEMKLERVHITERLSLRALLGYTVLIWPL